jgi:hypothetical protein
VAVQPDGMLSAVLRDPEKLAALPIETVERLFAMYERDQARQAEVEFAQAKSLVEAETETVRNNARNQQTNSNYTKYDALCRVIKPIYTKHGFSLMFSEGERPRDGWIRIICDVMHRAGHREQRGIDLPADSSGIKGNTNKTMLHATGSTFSYGRRYLTLLIFNVATGDDDDGNAGGSRGRQSGEIITENQLADLRALIQEVGGTEEGICKWGGVERRAVSVHGDTGLFFRAAGRRGIGRSENQEVVAHFVYGEM